MIWKNVSFKICGKLCFKKYIFIHLHTSMLAFIHTKLRARSRIGTVDAHLCMR